MAGLSKRARKMVADASVSALWALPSAALTDRQRELAPYAQELYADAKSGKVRLFQPALWDYEVCAVISRAVAGGRIAEEEGAVAVALIVGLAVVRSQLPSASECYRFARKFRRTLWDSLYLECAEQNGATFWTADERLYNGVKDELPWVRWIGDYPLKRRRGRRGRENGESSMDGR